MVKIIINSCIVFVFLMVSNALICQKTHGKLYQMGKLSCEFYGILKDNNTCVVTGNMPDTVKGGVAYVFARFDTNATYIYNNTYHNFGREYAAQYGLIKNTSNEYFLPTIMGGGNYSTILKLDSLGKYVSKVEIAAKTGDGIGLKKVYKINTNLHYAILDIAKNGQGIFYFTDVYLFRQDLSLIKKVSIMDSPKTLQSSASYLLPNKHLILVSGDNYFNSRDIKDSTVVWTVLDTNLNIVKTKKFAKKYHEVIYDLVDNGANNYFVCGKWMDTLGFEPNVGNYHKNQGYIANLDSNFNVKWELKLGFKSPIPSFYRIKKLKDGNFLAIGTGFDKVKNPTNIEDSAYNFGWAIKFNSNGTILWDKKYTNAFANIENENNFRDFEELESGNIMIAGYVLDFYDSAHTIGRGPLGWIVKISTNGDLIKSNIINPITLDIFPTEYPNPFENYIKIDGISNKINHLIIYNLDGKIVYSEKTNNRNQVYVNTETLPQDIYFINYFDKDYNLIYSSKLIK